MMFLRNALLSALSAAALAGAGPARWGSFGPGHLDVGDDMAHDIDVLAQLVRRAYSQTKLSLTSRSSSSSNNSNHDNSTGSQCTWENIRVRKEWGMLTGAERIAYTDAVRCLQSRPARSPRSLVPGARSRYDDFVVTHMNQTGLVHNTANFLSWHRYYVWLYEEALREECGYTGYQPYWDWTITAQTGLHASPIFDGSPTSMSGDGAPVPGQPPMNMTSSDPLAPPVVIPAGTGGGCVTSGPFAGMTVNLGPVLLPQPGGGLIDLRVSRGASNPIPGASNSNASSPALFAHNPRCLRRSLTVESNRLFANASSVASLVARSADVGEFQAVLQGSAPGRGAWGPHGGGHYALGGDPGRDPYVSPGDPVFFLHHAMLDRVWWVWQMQVEAAEEQGQGREQKGGEGAASGSSSSSRVWGPGALMGTNTQLNQPPSANTTLDDWLGYGFAAGPARRIREAMSTTAGAFCYVYL